MECHGWSESRALYQLVQPVYIEEEGKCYL